MECYSEALGSSGTGRVPQEEFGKTYVSISSGLENASPASHTSPVLFIGLGKPEQLGELPGPRVGEYPYTLSSSPQVCPLFRYLHLGLRV